MSYIQYEYEVNVYNSTASDSIDKHILWCSSNMDMNEWRCIVTSVNVITMTPWTVYETITFYFKKQSDAIWFKLYVES